MIVEDGTAPAGANSYATEARFEAHCDAHGITFTGDVETALVRATAWIDGRYRSRFPGTRTNGRAQSLEWPRKSAFDRAGEDLADDEIPVEIVEATIVAALQELTSSGSLYPAVTAGGAVVKRIKAGPVEKEFDTTRAVAPSTLTLQAVDDVLTNLLAPAVAGGGGAMVPLLRS